MWASRSGSTIHYRTRDNFVSNVRVKKNAGPTFDRTGVVYQKKRLTIKEILTWADAHFKRTRRWPTAESGRVVGGRGETWQGISTALRKGCRGFRGGNSLFRVLKKHRGARNENDGIVLTKKQILAWSDEYHRRHGKWPSCRRGDEVPGVPWESWLRIDAAFVYGLRGLAPGGSSLARFLREQRGVPFRMDLPRLTIKQIVAWADAHHHATGHWPMSTSAEVPDAPRETWGGLNASLRVGRRGLKGGDTLANVLLRRRGVAKRTRRRVR